MITNCEGNIPANLTTDPCKGKRYSTGCVIHPTAISILELPSDSTQEEINNALFLALQSALDRITLLEGRIEDHESRISNLE